MSSEGWVVEKVTGELLGSIPYWICRKGTYIIYGNEANMEFAAELLNERDNEIERLNRLKSKYYD